MVLEKIFESPLNSKEVQSVHLKEISPKYTLEGLMLKLKLQYFGHLMQRANSLEKTLILGKIEDKRKGQLRMRWLDSITSSIDMNYSKLQEFPGGSERKESACNVGEPGLIPGSGRCPGEGNGNPLQYSCLENPMDRGA